MSSTLLQVLLSLQGLVLGDSEPFFLEAGYESKRRSATHCAVASVQYNETALLLALSLDAAQLTQLDPEWAPLVQSHFAAPDVLGLFQRLQQAATQLSSTQTQTQTQQMQERTAEEERTIRSTLQLFSIPMGKALWEGPTAAQGGAAAGTAAQPSSIPTASGDGDSGRNHTPLTKPTSSTAEETKDDEEKLPAPAPAPAPSATPAPAAASGSASLPPPPSSLSYAPSSGFLSALSRHLHRLQAALSKNAALFNAQRLNHHTSSSA